MMRTYRLTPRDMDNGGGWDLHLEESGESAGGGAFPLGEHLVSTLDEATAEEIRAASEAAAGDAELEGESWVSGGN